MTVRFKSSRPIADFLPKIAHIRRLSKATRFEHWLAVRETASETGMPLSLGSELSSSLTADALMAIDRSVLHAVKYWSGWQNIWGAPRPPSDGLGPV